MSYPKILPGTPDRLGLCIEGNRANFALYSSHATRVILGLFVSGKEAPTWEFETQRTGDIWHIGLEGLPGGLLYAFRCVGPFAPEKGLLFKGDLWLGDPYAKILATFAKWGEPQQEKGRAFVVPIPPFDWEGVSPPRIPSEELIIYEMHIRGFTRHPSSGV